MNLGFDLDGVLYPWHEKVHREMLHRGETTESFDKFWQEGWLRMKEENRVLYMNYVNDPLMYSSSAPYYTVEDLLNSWKNQGHKIWYITQRPLHLKFVTESWVKRWKFPYPENLIRVEESKKLPVIENEIDLFVEDAIRHAEELKNYTKVILIKRPYNKEIQKEFITISNVTELPQYINGKE